jgi:flagella basal body P-ring formation protein FlgA
MKRCIAPALVLRGVLCGVLGSVLSGGVAAAQPLDQIVRERVAPALAGGLGVARVHIPAQLAKLDLDPAHVAVEVPRELRAGRPSIKVTVRGRPAQFVPISIAQLAEVAIAQHALAPGAVIGAGDIVVEQRAIDGAAPAPVNSVVGATVTRPLSAGAPIAGGDVALPPPLSRGAQVTVEIRRGSVRVRGAATLEAAARPGDPATARLSQMRTLVRGTLVAPSIVVVVVGE